MNPKPLLNTFPALLWRRPWLTAVAVLVLALALALLLRPAGGTAAATAFHEVRRGDFTVSIVEGGTLSAVSEVVVRNEVDGTARIIWIVPEGSYVQKGDLLVELDSAQAEDQLNLQQINFEKARFGVEQARTTLEIMRSATNSDYLAADLKLKFAKIDRDKFEQGQRMVDLIEASNKVVQAEALLAVNMDTFINSTNLAARGYETRQKVDGDRLTVMNTQNALIVATNTLWMLEEFDLRKQRAKYDADVLQADQELERVVTQNRRKMAQYEADLQTQLNTLQLSEEKLERDRKNLEATKIYAPQDGLVVYQTSANRWSSESLIEGGAIVRNRQELIKLPDLSRMKVTIQVHESHVNMVRPGLHAFVVLDSSPDVRYRGLVERVAPLPDTQSRWGNPNLKVYNTDVYITDPMPNIKPGVSAKAEIIITNVPDSLTVPIQAVTTLKGEPVVYLASMGKPQPKTVEVGLFNTKFIQVVNGIKERDRVLLSPPIDTQEKDLEGGVLNDEEKKRIQLTNAPAAPPLPAQPIAADADHTRPGGTNDGPGLSREERLKRFDKNGDGRLDEAERAAMRESMGGSDRGNREPRADRPATRNRT